MAGSFISLLRRDGGNSSSSSGGGSGSGGGGGSGGSSGSSRMQVNLSLSLMKHVVKASILNNSFISKPGPVIGGDDDNVGFSFSAYCCILNFPLAFLKKYKILVTTRGYQNVQSRIS
jgi:hypothetical protein